MNNMFNALQHLPEELSAAQELLSWHPPEKLNMTASPSLPVLKEMTENVQPPLKQKSNTCFKPAAHPFSVSMLEGEGRLRKSSLLKSCQPCSFPSPSRWYPAGCWSDECCSLQPGPQAAEWPIFWPDGLYPLGCEPAGRSPPGLSALPARGQTFLSCQMFSISEKELQTKELSKFGTRFVPPLFHSFISSSIQQLFLSAIPPFVTFTEFFRALVFVCPMHLSVLQIWQPRLKQTRHF